MFVFICSSVNVLKLFSCVSFCSYVWLLQRLLGQWVTWWHMINWKNSFPNSFPLYWASTRRIQNTTSSARYSSPLHFTITGNVCWKLIGQPLIQSKFTCTCFPPLWTLFILCSIKTWKCVIVFALFKQPAVTFIVRSDFMTSLWENPGLCTA